MDATILDISQDFRKSRKMACGQTGKKRLWDTRTPGYGWEQLTLHDVSMLFSVSNCSLCSVKGLIQLLQNMILTSLTKFCTCCFYCLGSTISINIHARPPQFGESGTFLFGHVCSMPQGFQHIVNAD